MAQTIEDMAASLISSLAQDNPEPKTEQMRLESSFINYLLDYRMMVVTREDLQNMQLLELVAMIQSWARAVAAGRCVV